MIGTRYKSRNNHDSIHTRTADSCAVLCRCLVSRVRVGLDPRLNLRLSMNFGLLSSLVFSYFIGEESATLLGCARNDLSPFSHSHKNPHFFYSEIQENN